MVKDIYTQFKNARDTPVFCHGRATCLAVARFRAKAGGPAIHFVYMDGQHKAGHDKGGRRQHYIRSLPSIFGKSLLVRCADAC